MRLATTRLFPVALLLALALLTFYLKRTVEEEGAHGAQHRHDPDYIVSDFTTTTYSGSGLVLSVLSAAKMVHYPDDDSTELVAPRVLQTKPDHAPLSVSADRGALSGDGDQIFLYGNVVLVRKPTATQPEARLTTSFLHIVTDRSLVLTDREVHLVEARRSLTGRGMEYDSALQTFNLRADVHGEFSPEPKP